MTVLDMQFCPYTDPTFVPLHPTLPQVTVRSSFLLIPVSVWRLVRWYFQPSRPQRITSRLKTMFNLSPIYSARKSSNHKLSPKPKNQSWHKVNWASAETPEKDKWRPHLPPSLPIPHLSSFYLKNNNNNKNSKGDSTVHTILKHVLLFYLFPAQKMFRMTS